MIISETTYYIIVGIIVACGILPLLYGRITKTGKFGWTWVIILLTIPLNWFTPAIYDVTDCGVYTKEVLLLPKGDYSLGRHNYIINNSDKDIFFENLVYGDAKLDEDEHDMIIAPETVYKAPVITIDYLFAEAPSSVRIKGSGATKRRLSCDVPEWEEEEDSIFEEELDEESIPYEGEREGVEVIRTAPHGE